MNKLSDYISQAVAQVATAVLFIAAIITPTATSEAKKTTSTAPDFAYPQTVEKNAGKDLDAAIASGNWQKAIVASIQKITASNLVSNENAVKGISELDSIINITPNSWKPAFQLIEADLYNSICDDIGWEAEHRKLPSDSVPANPFEWSRNLFANKIFTLCSDILANHDNDGKSLELWKPFLTKTEMAFKYGMTIDEFLAERCFNILDDISDTYDIEFEGVIPFFGTDFDTKTPLGKCRELRQKAIDILIDKASAMGHDLLEAQSIVDKADYTMEGLRPKILLSAFDKLRNTEGSQIILSNLNKYIVDDNDIIEAGAYVIGKSKYVGMLRQSIKDFPNGLYVNSLKNILSNLTLPKASFDLKRTYLTSDDINIDATLSNCNETWILVYDYSIFDEDDIQSRQSSKDQKKPDNKEVASKCKLVKAVKVSADGTAPFTINKKVNLGALPNGIYALLPSATPTGKGLYPTISKDKWRSTVTVTDISSFTLHRPDSTTLVFVVEGINGCPIEGASVKVFSRESYDSPPILSKTLYTDSAGCVAVSDKLFEYEAVAKGSVWRSFGTLSNLNEYKRQKDTITRKNANILIDRSIYHPGDSIRGSMIASSSKNFDIWLNPNQKYIVTLKDANRKKISSTDIMTDTFGRAAFSFLIPESGLRGRWNVSATDSLGRSVDNLYFQVADYVAPTFFISSTDDDIELSAGDTVNIKGQVLTYSGMPVANATVDFDVSHRSPDRWFSSSSASYNSSVTTDADGNYVITLPTANLKDTQFEKGVYTINVTATSPSGETQSGPSVRFALGQEYDISAVRSRYNFEISDSIPTFKFNVTNILGKKVKKELKYTLINLATLATVEEGTCMSPGIQLKNKKYESAKYKLKVALANDSTVTAEKNFIMWRKSDKDAPAGVKLWVPYDEYYATPGVNKFDVTIGSGIADQWIPAVLSANDSIMHLEWIHIDKENKTIEVDVPTGNERYSLNVLYLSNADIDSERIGFYSADDTNDLDIKTESFRDKISSGDRESWKFKFNKSYGEVGEIPVLAVMTDAALNHIEPFTWNHRLRYFWNNFDFPTFDRRYNYTQTFRVNMATSKSLPTKSLTYPLINDYQKGWGLNEYPGRYVVLGYGTVRNYANARSEKSVMMKSAATADFGPAAKEEEVVVREDGFDEADIETVAAGVSSDYLQTGKNELRETECPVAFFMPYLTTDKDGVVNINFTVPNFNTTWQLQVLGYDESLKTAYKKLETVASKPVMVSAHSPRFVRTGDVIELTATLFNNTGEKADIGGRIELVNLLNGKVITVKEYNPESVDASASRLVSMTWTVPSDVSSVGFRAYAEGNGHRDGEQALLPVLPASSPVIESTPFWLAPNQRVFEIQLPKFKDSDKVTLQYCDNPAWYCLTALPGIMETDSKSNLAKAFALYGNAMAYNLISSNPSLKKGLETLLSDQNSEFAALKSNLEKDGNLKIAQLNNTPWVNDAETEIIRMSRLSELLDDEYAEKVIYDQINDLMRLQNREGGWSWCPDMRPSLFITQTLVRNFALMQRAGALKKFRGTNGIIESAVKYVDNEIITDYKKYHTKDESLSYLLNWIFTRSSLSSECIPVGNSSIVMSSLIGRALNDIAKEWKGYGIREKAEAAIVLWRNGQKKTALEILESLRQYASVTPQKGVWFDNLNSGYYGSSALFTTTMVLKAFAEIEPENNMIDGLRQWLILSRQTEDWGRNIVTVETINAILTAGNNWTPGTDTMTPEFQLKSNPIKLPETAALTGAFTVNLDAKQASGKKLKISRSGNSPAWGGVISQYEAPLKDIKAANLPEMSIRKELVALVDEGNGTLVPKSGITLKKGMKVRVTLTISTDRDMDYVALTDERSACLEPTDQISHYTSTDGVWYYQEVRNENTNLYFDFLPKGHHVISYDCTVAQDGTFSCGIATMQSQYTPTLVCHSAADIIEVN